MSARFAVCGFRASHLAVLTIVALNTACTPFQRETPRSAAASPGAAALLAAKSRIGTPYRYGGSGPDAFDCSGLVCFVFAQIGVGLPRVTYSQVRCGRAVAPGELAPGDLVFFRKNGHVGIYLGGGWYVHAPRTGDVVKISALGARSDLSACRRVL